jgi:ATP-dependent DNA helicase RecG
MNLAELQSLVAQGENDKVEFKKSTGQRTDAAKTVCAMLNGMGGFVIFGVAPDGTIVGQEIGARTIEDIANCIAQIEPSAFPNIETVALDNNLKVIIVKVPGGGLYTYEGRAYMRFGPTTRIMPHEYYQRKVIERMNYVWENQPAIGFTVDDLDHAEITRTVDEAIRRGRMDELRTRAPEALLRGMNLMYEGQLLNAAVVLFGKNNLMFPMYPQCILRAARFRGTDKSEFIDNRQFIGNAFEIFVRAQEFWRQHLPIAGRILPNVFERVDDPLYPPEALREALANAICHRDYALGGGAITLAIYDDRLEIGSIGTLPFGITADDLTRPHHSRLRNPLIAHAFYRRGIIEEWGRGTLKILEWSEEAGMQPPEFESNTHEVMVRFKSKTYIPPLKIEHKLTPLQREILQIMAIQRSTTLSNIRDALSNNPARRTVQDNLVLLRQLGAIESKGQGKAARWILK